MRKQLAIVGIVFLFIAFFLMTVGLVSQNARADGASGTWTGTCTDTMYVATNYYDVVLELRDDGSGTLTLTLTHQDAGSGWTNPPLSGEIEVSYTLSGSELTLRFIYYTANLRISGYTMAGEGQGTDPSNIPHTWKFDLEGGGGLFGSLAIPSAAIAFTGGAFGLATSLLPAPRGITGFRGQTTYSLSAPGGTRAFRGRTRKQPHYNHPIVTQKYRTSIPPPPVVATPPPPVVTPAALRDPNETLGWPLQPPGTTNGGHLVPWDAPMQCPNDQYPRDYPYPEGTSAAMKCPYCGCNTLAPFTTGWFCTNPMCPARREWLQKRCTHHEFNNMTWRVL